MPLSLGVQSARIGASGASSHKFSSGSHAEGRIAGKAAVKYIVENSDQPTIHQDQVDMWKEKIFAPLDLYAALAEVAR